MKQVAVVGIQGVPASYGGFETLVDNIIDNSYSSKASYTIFCSSKDMSVKQKEYKKARLIYLPLHANGFQSILYDIVSLIRATSGYDAVLILGVSGCVFLPIFKLFSRARVIVNIDGVEHGRKKWGEIASWFLKISERAAITFADVIIADNKGISDYVQKTYNKKAELIAYGSNHAIRSVEEMQESSILKQYDLSSKKYALSICRIEPENNCHITLEAYSKTDKQLVFVGNWDKKKYGKELKKKYQQYNNIKILDSIYDLDTLYILRKNAQFYIHGHSAGGTNPSLIEAMLCACHIISYDVIYNRETTEGKACYYQNGKELEQLISQTEKGEENSIAMREIAIRRYNWDTIAKQYEKLY